MAIQETVDETALIAYAVTLSLGCTGILVGNGEPDIDRYVISFS